MRHNRFIIHGKGQVVSQGVFLWGLVSFGLGWGDCGHVSVWLVFGQGWVGSWVWVLVCSGCLYPTPHLSHLSLSVCLLVMCGPELVFGVPLLSIAFMIVMNLDNLLMPFLVPTSLSKCVFLPMPRSDHWFRYFWHSLSMCCLFWIVHLHLHVGSLDLPNLDYYSPMFACPFH